MVTAARKSAGWIMTLLAALLIAGCATDVEVERTRLPGVDSPEPVKTQND